MTSRAWETHEPDTKDQNNTKEQDRFAAALLDPAQPCPEALHAWNGSDPNHRFGVYRNNVMISLIDALAATFPVCQQLVGEAFFRAMARTFVGAHPPSSRVLMFYGREFPAFVETFPPASSVPYLADMARLEMARLSGLHAADVEPLPAEDIAALLASPDRLATLRITLHPSVAVVQSPFAVLSLWQAHQQASPQLADIQPRKPETAVVVRSGLAVHCLEVGAGTGVFIAQLLHDATLSQAELAATERDSTFDLIAPLTLLVRWQMMTAFNPGD